MTLTEFKVDLMKALRGELSCKKGQKWPLDSKWTTSCLVKQIDPREFCDM